MAFKTLQELTGVNKYARGGRSKFRPEDVAFGIDRVGPSNGKQREKYVIRIAVPYSVCKKARMVAGDKVEILFDEENKCGLLRRVIKGGLTLSAAGKKGRLTVKTSYHPGLPSVAESVGCLADVTDDGIVFMLPDSVSFEKNLRA